MYAMCLPSAGGGQPETIGSDRRANVYTFALLATSIFLNPAEELRALAVKRKKVYTLVFLFVPT